MRVRPAFLALAALMAALGLAGCQDLFNALFDDAAPTAVSASDGDYASEITIGWGAPNLSSDKWKGYEVEGYQVSWDEGPLPNTTFVTGTSYSIPVGSDYRAMKYRATVQTVFKSGSTGGSASDDGFALDTEQLIWYDGGAVHAYGGADRWYVTMLQRGFSYDFDISGGGHVEFYPYKGLDLLRSTSDPGTRQSWTCDEDGSGSKFYVHVVSNATSLSFAASYRF